jgi:hypothetical protein
MSPPRAPEELSASRLTLGLEGPAAAGESPAHIQQSTQPPIYDASAAVVIARAICDGHCQREGREGMGCEKMDAACVQRGQDAVAALLSAGWSLYCDR